MTLRGVVLIHKKTMPKSYQSCHPFSKGITASNSINNSMFNVYFNKSLLEIIPLFPESLHNKDRLIKRQ